MAMHTRISRSHYSNRFASVDTRKKGLSFSDVICFLGFMLLVVGNGKFIEARLGYGIEYLGLLMLLTLVLMSKLDKSILIKDIVFFAVSVSLMSLGPAVLNLPSSTRLTITFTTIALVAFSSFSDGVLSSRHRLSLMIRGVISGCVVTVLIGLVTGTLGLRWAPDDAIAGLMFTAGFSVKNYIGGLWLALFLCLYTLGICSQGCIDKRCKRHLVILFVLMVLSGSKGAVALSVIFLCLMNYKQFLSVGRSHERIFSVLLLAVVVTASIFIYTNVLNSISTYEYRINGLSSIIEILRSNPSEAVFGLSDIAYANTGYDYTVNLRNYFGWDASVEMAYVNAVVKFGVFGFLALGMIFCRLLSRASKLDREVRTLAYSLIVIVLASGFIETYFVTVHYVVGPMLYCLINGLVFDRFGNACGDIEQFE